MKRFDEVGFIMDYENGVLNDHEIARGFQKLLDSGTVWNLQGAYQRAALALLDAGLIHRRDRWADGEAYPDHEPEAEAFAATNEDE